MENIKIPEFLERNMKEIVAQPINDINRFIERIYLSAPKKSFNELKDIFSIKKSKKISKNRKPLIYGVDKRHYGKIRHKGNNYSVRLYDSVDHRRDPFIYIPRPTFDLLEALAYGTNYRVELVKFSMDIKCKNLLATRLVFDAVREFGYFPTYYKDTTFSQTYKDITNLPKKIGSSFRIRRNKESLLNAPRVVVRESSEALKRPEKGFPNKELDRVRVSIWKYAEGKGKNISLKDFIEEEKDFHTLHNNFKFRDIPSNKEKMSFYEKFVGSSDRTTLNLKPREAPSDIFFISEKLIR